MKKEINFVPMKWGSYILLSVVFFMAIGTSGIFFWQLQQIKISVNKEFTENEHANFLSFRFTQKEFSKLVWIEKGKEFRLNGKMYDIYSVSKVNDSILINCIYDTQETQLRKTFANLFASTSSQNLPLRHLVKIWTQKYFQEVSQNSILFSSEQLTSKPYVFSVIINYIYVEEHPPQFSF